MIPLFKFFDETDTTLYPRGAKYAHLFPDNIPLTAEDIEQIKVHFANRLVCHSYPQYWLSKFHNVVKRESVKWRKLIESEDILTPDDAHYNYDLHENGTNSGTGNYTDNGTNQATQTANDFTSDTPDNAVDDIERYMSTAGRSSVTNGGTASSTGNNSNSSEYAMRRYGNIGVQTAAQIMGGYRESVKYCAYDTIFEELEPLFIGTFGDEWEDYGYNLEGWEGN